MEERRKGQRRVLADRRKEERRVVQVPVEVELRVMKIGSSRDLEASDSSGPQERVVFERQTRLKDCAPASDFTSHLALPVIKTAPVFISRFSCYEGLRRCRSRRSRFVPTTSDTNDKCQYE